MKDDMNPAEQEWGNLHLSDERYVENRRALAGGRDLLAELEQAEREWQSWKILADRANEQRYELIEKLGHAEAQLVVVPALVEQYDEMVGVLRYEGYDIDPDCADEWQAILDARSKWEQAQGENP